MAANTSQLAAYARHVGAAVDRAEPELTTLVAQGATTGAAAARSLIGALTEGTFLPHYPKSIGFDMVGRLAAEFGPDSSKPQGGMGRGIEFGSATTGPKPHMLPAADIVEQGFGGLAGAVLERVLR
jgi:hypothetical protein